MLKSRVSSRTFRIITYVAVGGVAFQVAHFVEHLAQLAYWFIHPLEAPWLTPWAVAGRDMLAAGGAATTGAELLHLIGNTIFFVALIAMCSVLACKDRTLADDQHLKKAVVWQAVHVAEHVALTATWLVFGKTIGISTLFGFAAGNAAFASSYRVWWHFVVNLVVTVYAARSLKRFADERLLFPDLEPATA